MTNSWRIGQSIPDDERAQLPVALILSFCACCAILTLMKTKDDHTELIQWAKRLEASGLGSVLGALLRALRPLAPLGAGALWIMQPALGLFVDRDDVASWAQRLEDPDALARLSARLAGEEPDHDE